MNEDFDSIVVMHGASMLWTDSPNPHVQRKRLELHGPVEAGRVTSIVRYLENSSFHAHDHPEGEEILVLSGVFEDETGAFPAGSYLLNPEGFRHQPFSKDGCVLFVKLRQFPGPGRERVCVDSEDQGLWGGASHASLQECSLYSNLEHFEQISLIRPVSNASIPVTELLHWNIEDGIARGRRVVFELFVVRGSCSIGEHCLKEQSWIRAKWEQVIGDAVTFGEDLSTLVYLRIGHREF